MSNLFKFGDAILFFSCSFFFCLLIGRICLSSFFLYVPVCHSPFRFFFVHMTILFNLRMVCRLFVGFSFFFLFFLIFHINIKYSEDVFFFQKKKNCENDTRISIDYFCRSAGWFEQRICAVRIPKNLDIIFENFCFSLRR